MGRLSMSIALAGALSCASAVAADGADLYKSRCSACHGPSGGGDVKFKAPPLAGFDAGYISRQLRAFRAGHRGGDNDQPSAKAMRSVSQGLNSDEDIDALARYVSRLQPSRTAKANASAGQISAGKALFGVCVACHGGTGEGNTALQAPRIAHLPPWYLMGQLMAFRNGTRGSAPEDTLGQQMRQVAMEALGNADEVGAVAAYITTLAPGREQGRP